MNSLRSHAQKPWAYALAVALAGLMAVTGTPLTAEAPSSPTAEPATSSPAPKTQAEKDRAAAQVETYKRAVPPGGWPEDIEGENLKVRTAREWHLLTYPTGTLPAMPMTRAREWVRGNVTDASEWPGPPVRLKNAGPSLRERATVTPSTTTWTAVGPMPLDSTGTANNAFIYGTVGGRVGTEALASDPNDSSVAYAGFVAGGLWKTTNLGSASVTWTPLWDDKDNVSQSVGAIEIDPNDSNTLYVGTGDWPALDQFSSGIMKSTDAGATWTQLAADVFAPYAPALPVGGNRWSNQNIKTVRVDPNDSNTVLVGTRYDLYISNDAGATWQICGFGSSYTDPAAGGPAITTINRISDIYLDDRGAQTVAYVAVGYQFNNFNGNNGVYRFTVPATGCPSWPGDFTTLFGGFPAGTGNGVNNNAGGSNTGRIELAGAVGPDSGLTLYAQVATASNNTAEGTYVLRPDGGSTTWTKLSGSTSAGYQECDGSSSGTQQDWYDLFLAVDPTDDKTLYIGHIDAFRATVSSGYSSISFTNLTNVYSTGCPEYSVVHPDQHAFTFVSGSGGNAFLLGNDGGVYYNDNQGALANWQQVNDDFNVHQFYGGQIGADFAGNGMNGEQWLFGGMQDNGNASWSSATADATWTARGVGGDGYYTTFDPLSGDLTNGLWITEYSYGSMYCSSSGADGPFGTGQGPFLSTCSPTYAGSPDWSTPFMIDALHCTTSSCDNYMLGEDYVWVSTSIRRGKPEWTRVSGSLVSNNDNFSIITVNMAPSEPKAAAVGTDDGKVWWSETMFSGGSCTLAAANTSSFSCSANTGASWIDADPSNTVLPNRAVLQVAFDPQDHNLFYAAVGGFDENTPGTPGHLFALEQSGGSITVTDKTGNLPNVPASSVAVNPHDRKQVFVGTHFGFYYTDDIDAGTVTWTRFQDGLPNTVIKHLTIDRGPDNDPLKGTTLAAFTYGRGVFVLGLPGSGPCTPPAAPSGLAASAPVDNQIDLTWTASAGATEYRVYRATSSGGPYTQIASGVAGTSYSDTTVGAGTTYYYIVRAFADCESGDSNEASATATGNQAPTAAFTSSCTDLSCSFTDGSSDPDGSIATWSWNFGDGNSSTAQNPNHTYGAAGTYTVTLTVTDNGGATDNASDSVTVSQAGAITLSASGYKVKGVKTIDLTWSGATGATVDVYRDGALLTNTANDGAFTDSTGQKGGGSHTHQVCEAGSTTNCSNVTTTVF